MKLKSQGVCFAFASCSLGGGQPSACQGPFHQWSIGGHARLDQFQLTRVFRGGADHRVAISTLSTWEGQQRNALFSLARATSTTAPKENLFKVAKIKGDGRCMFRALALGMALNKGTVLTPQTEEVDADSLRMAVAEALCTSEAHRKQYPEALISLSSEDTIPRYCRRLTRPDFWGGEVELLVLSKMLKVPIIVYQSMTELTGKGGGFRPLVHFGEEYSKSTKQRRGRRPVRLLYTGGNHYDLLH